MADLNELLSNQDEPLKHLTQARIGLGMVGAGIPTQQYLRFKLAHAHARDAVYSALETDRLYDKLLVFNLPVLPLQSQAADREQYLQRPDLGRLPDEASMNRLADQVINAGIVLIIADGLSAAAVNQHAVPLLSLLIPKLIAVGHKIAPVCLAEQARVAIADTIAAELGATLSVILIGERPGLSAADSMGAYLTYQPKRGLTDDARNCVSNIRPKGLPIAVAAEKLFYLIQEAYRLKLSGVELKDNQGLLR
ncbi:ethanolamine ammonia-lyase subunit EutC [Mucilaginibacter terrenus]|uniref:Ethanolamine ammonia-lyase small subunit n=1 Tax=Mucilaginibacter terrenus TaxID=2482727 RepID=A0A3E2NM74_9SPHI|nr:ethanolamine ammonia-lyase subunit EutC [Mucilaginibacter terrenus]RFZ82043.1 ethanolamine ammonia-lyase subunit EutC [Mucilaginibacter terrenus]